MENFIKNKMFYFPNHSNQPFIAENLILMCFSQIFATPEDVFQK